MKNGSTNSISNIWMLIAAGAIIAVVCGYAGYLLGVEQNQAVAPPDQVFPMPVEPDGGIGGPVGEGEGVACTMDAKICPDGSAVGRSGPNCEFAPCPGE